MYQSQRFDAGSAVLQNGKVLIVGGYNAKEGPLATAELFNPETNTFEAVASKLTEERDSPVAATLTDGRVLVVGGSSALPTYSTKVEITSFTLALASTGAATAIGTSSATLNGTVTGETASSVHYQHGTTTAYGSSSTAQGVAASIAGRSTAIGVGGLTPGTTYHFRVVAKDGAGASYGPDQTFATLTAPVPPPSLSAVTQSHSVWRTGGSLASISRKRKVPVGTVFSFSLNEQANVRLTFTQARGVRRVKGRCFAPKHRNRHAHRRHRTVTIGVVSLTGHAGVDHVAFQGRMSSSVRLHPGSYTVTISAVNSAGQRSSVQRLAFKSCGKCTQRPSEEA